MRPSEIDKSSDIFLLTLVGLPGVGKSTISSALSKRDGFNWIKSRDIVGQLTDSKHGENLQERGLYLSTEEGSKLFCQSLFSWMHLGHINIFDSVRPIAHWRVVKEKFRQRVLLVGFTLDEMTRRHRLVERDGAAVAYKRSSHEVEKDVPLLLTESDLIVDTKGSEDSAVQTILDKITQYHQSIALPLPSMVSF